MAHLQIQSSAKERYGDMAPTFVRYTEDVLFGMCGEESNYPCEIAA